MREAGSRVLIVDDDHDVRGTMRRLVERGGIQTSEASDGRMASARSGTSGFIENGLSSGMGCPRRGTAKSRRAKRRAVALERIVTILMMGRS